MTNPTIRSFLGSIGILLTTLVIASGILCLYKLGTENGIPWHVDLWMGATTLVGPNGSASLYSLGIVICAHLTVWTEVAGWALTWSPGYQSWEERTHGTRMEGFDFRSIVTAILSSITTAVTAQEAVPLFVVSTFLGTLVAVDYILHISHDCAAKFCDRLDPRKLGERRA